MHTWVEAAFHVLPYPVLNGAHKLTRANLRVHLCWKNKADLRSVCGKWEEEKILNEGWGWKVTPAWGDWNKYHQWVSLNTHFENTCLFMRSWISCNEKKNLLIVCPSNWHSKPPLISADLLFADKCIVFPFAFKWEIDSHLLNWTGQLFIWSMSIIHQAWRKCNDTSGQLLQLCRFPRRCLAWLLCNLVLTK